LHVTLPDSDFDRVCVVAMRQHLSPAGLVRKVLAQALRLDGKSQG
jgi:hypothetical protein